MTGWRAQMNEPPAPGHGLICVVEIPKGSKNKYEYDEELGGFVLDRHLTTAAVYPADYGFLRGTLGQDGDALDALVFLSEPTFAGCLIAVKPIGMFAMEDEHGIDHKIMCVPASDPRWSPLESIDDLSADHRDEIEQFFSIYKVLERKRVDPRGWYSREEANEEIEAAKRRLQARPRRGDAAGAALAQGARRPSVPHDARASE